MGSVLDSLGIGYTEQVSTRSGFVLDFAIYHDDGFKIDIETDGRPWHSSPKQRKRDAFRDWILRREGWIVLRFGEDFTRDEVAEKLQAIMPP